MTTAIDTGDWKNIHPPDKQVRVRGETLTLTLS